MDAQKLYEEVFRNLRSGRVASLPFLIPGKDKDTVLSWFYYTVKDDGDDLILSVREVAISDRDLNSQILKSNLSIRKTVGNYMRPRLEKADYYEQLVLLMDSYDMSKMELLLRSAEAEPLWEVYEKVALSLEEGNLADRDKKKNVQEEKAEQPETEKDLDQPQVILERTGKQTP